MKTRFNRREFSLGALAASTALARAGRPARAQAAPVKIRVGWVVVPASLAPLILEKKDILKHFGQSYVAEAIRFEGTPPVITALASGELDIGPLAFSTFGLAIQNAHMDDLRVISDEIQDGVAGHGSNEFMVLKDGPVKTVADLKGKVLATNALGSAVDIAMRAMLRKNGLEANKDYTIVEAPFPAMRAVLSEKKADLISAVPPFSLDPRIARHGEYPVHAKGRLRHHATHHVDGAHRLHPAEPRSVGRFSGRRGARGALVHRSAEPRGSRRHRGAAEQGAAGAHGMGVRRARSISRSERHAEHRGAAE